MAAYPSSLPVDLRASGDRVRDGRKLDEGSDNYTRVRKTAADKHSWTLTHTKLTAAQLATLDAHYAAMGGSVPALSFPFVSPFDGGSYMARYTAPPQPKNEEGPFITMIVTLAQAS